MRSHEGPDRGPGVRGGNAPESVTGETPDTRHSEGLDEANIRALSDFFSDNAAGKRRLRPNGKPP